MYADCVRIVDKFLNPSDLKSVIDRIRGMKWQVQSSSKNRGLMFLYEEVTDQEFFNTYLCNKIREELKIDNQLERIYFNGQWSGREGSFHVDGCDKTVLIISVTIMRSGVDSCTSNLQKIMNISLVQFKIEW